MLNPNLQNCPSSDRFYDGAPEVEPLVEHLLSLTSRLIVPTVSQLIAVPQELRLHWYVHVDVCYSSP